MRSRVRVQEPRALQDVEHAAIDVTVLLSRVASFGILAVVVILALLPRFGVTFDINNNNNNNKLC